LLCPQVMAGCGRPASRLGVAAAVNVTKAPLADKSLREIMEQAEAVQRFVVEAVGAGRPLYDIERGVLDQVLRIGRCAIDVALSS